MSIGNDCLIGYTSYWC